MAQPPGAAASDGFLGTPGIREMRPESDTLKVDDGIGSGGNPTPGIRRVSLRAEIDTSPPFGSVKEAVTRFGGSGPWIPLYKLGEAFYNVDFDVKKVEEQATELEKDLIVKELETLDVLEEIGATKRIVDELKQQLQTEALKCLASPDVNSYGQVEAPVIKEMNKENYGIVNNQEQISKGPCPCSISSSDLISIDLKQAKVNLCKTINDLGLIQSSVESLNKMLKNEKIFLKRTCEKLASKFAAVSAQKRAQEQTSYTFDNDFESDAGQYNRTVETKSEVSKSLPEYEENGFSNKTAEVMWFAAKKMEEAARAAEAIALAEIKALSNAERSSGFAQPEPEKMTFALEECSPLNPKAQIAEKSTFKKVINSKFQTDETIMSKQTILKKLEEATEEVLHSKQVLTEALNRVETANRKQHAAEEALRRWIPVDEVKGEAVYNSYKCNKFNQAGNFQDSLRSNVTRSTTVKNNPKPVLRPTVSMRDVLSRKQVPEEHATRMEMGEHTERHKVALSQMLQALREDLTFPAKPEKDGSNQKQFIAQKKKFGFIPILLSLGKASKKRA